VRAALQLQPNLGLAHFVAAKCLEQQGLLVDALREAEEALQLAW
jgi:hypothetical protein